MKDEIVYQYPDYEKFKSITTSSNSKKTEKQAILFIGLIAISGLLFILYAALGYTGLLVSAFILIVFDIILLKQRNKLSAYICIEAYTDHMIIHGIDITTNRIIKTADIIYDEIVRAYFTDRSCTRLVITLCAEGKSVISNSDTKIFTIDLQPYTWQQGFFMYLSKEFFDIASPKEWQILKKYGSEYQFFATLETDEGGADKL